MSFRRLIALAIFPLVLAGCTYKGSPGEARDKEKADDIAIAIFIEYLDPQLADDFAKSKGEMPQDELARRITFKRAPDYLDPTRVDTTLFGKDVSQFRVMPLASEQAVISGTVTVGSRLIALAYALTPKGEQPIPPLTPKYQPDEEVRKQWTEQKNGTIYQFSYLHQKSDERVCVRELANAPKGNPFIVTCARTKDVGFAELERVVRAISVDGFVPAARP